MNEIEQAYMQGLVDYEAALLEQCMYAEAELAAASGPQDISLLQELAMREELIAKEAYAQGLMDYENSLLQGSLSSESDQEELAKEEAYQLGVMYAEAKHLINAIEAGIENASEELRSYFDQGVSDAEEALANQT